MPHDPQKVYLVLLSNFGDRLASLWDQHVWMVQSDENTQAVHAIATSEKASDRPQSGSLSTFPESDLSNEEAWGLLLETLEDHHGRYSQQPRWRALEVIGAELTAAAERALRTYDFTEFETLEGGFLATRSTSSR